MNFNTQNLSDAIPWRQHPSAVTSHTVPVETFRTSRVRDLSGAWDGVLVDNVYRLTIDALIDRRILDAFTGEEVQPLLPTTVAQLIRDGVTPLSIEQTKISLIDMAERSTNWNVTRSVPKRISRILEEQGRTNLLFEPGIVPVPGDILNVTLCAYLRTIFSESELLSVPGFILRTHTDEDGIFNALRLDIDSWLSRQGFFIPIRRDGLIRGLQVFRRPGDPRPFMLKSRGSEVPLNG